MATHQCDLVMKGGITSGVIYPRLVETLSRVYDFRSIGGTSAGAIAAGAAAAAQLGVHTGARPDAFSELGKLPDLLGGPARGEPGSMLLNLFQAQPSLRRHFALLTAALNARSKVFTALRLSWAVVRYFPVGALLGAAPGFAIFGTSHGLARWLGLAFAVLGLIVGAFVAALRSFARHLPPNDFGLCNGMPSGKSEADALTPWLHGYLNSLAGKAGDDPLTFGELWAGRLRGPGAASPHDGKAARTIELAMLTTALNLGRPFRFPFESNAFYFLKQEMDRLLPPGVAAWLATHARPSVTAERLSTPERTYLALPAPQDMPVLLGVRLSLSFPILLATIPLYAIDRSRRVNEPEPKVASRILFSDGGICSNFPVHFFDSPLPTRPTFAVNLREFHPDHAQERVWMPKPLKNNRGVKPFIPDLPVTPGLGSVFDFLGLIVNTMQNWRDHIQSGMPGFRDRIVHVSHSSDEGGLNLDMQQHVIDALGNSGASAATKLRDAFTPGQDARVGAWYNHRRIRMRTMLAGIDQQLRRVHLALGQVEPPTWVDVTADTAADAYQFASAEHRQLAAQILRSLALLGKSSRKARSISPPVRRGRSRSGVRRHASDGADQE